MSIDQSRSPLKAAPLRNPGQSLDREISALVDDTGVPYIIVACFMGVLAAMEWARSWRGSEPHPVFYSIVALFAIGICAWKLIGVKRELRKLRQGRDGERIVGQFLEELREQGYRVIHDIPGEKFNIDHVLIGPHGVYTVETKTIRKPARGEAKINFDGEQVLIGRFKPDRDPIVQARAEAMWLKNFFLESTGKKITVQPIVVFPGWYIDGPPKGTKSDVWVLNPKGLPAYVERRRETLSPEDVKLLNYHLSRYVRAVNV
jgi:hypothetical protein